ncbi:MAG TPA: M28 family peptidase [Vicinamibacterales bacterium]|nr:M28 family peptidase [Vicinamibacterales bacterium]
MLRPVTALFVSSMLLVGCGTPTPEKSGQTAAQFPLSSLPPIDANALLAHTRKLASDEFEGRGPGTRGEELTVEYLVDQFQRLGLKPGNADGSFVQQVPLVGITPTPSALRVDRRGTVSMLRWKDDVVAWSKRVAPEAKLANSELVFVGYGVVAPEYNWDDYKGVDVSGKTLIMLVGDPPVADPKNASELDSKVFGGRAMTYYGRWTYKFEMAAKKHAAGAFIIHETAAAGYPFDVVQSSWSGEQFDLVTPGKNMGRAAVEGWLSSDRGRELVGASGQDFDALKKLAATPGFEPVDLGATASMTIANSLRTVASTNVLARLDGADAAHRDEYVVYTAHWDHLGVGVAVNGDKIYNGAQDNAIGVAGLLDIARAYTKLAFAPRRSILFLSVTAEEQGLLGSEYYASTPVYPLAKTLAVINMDGLNVHGKTRDITVVGYGASDLDDYTRELAAEQGRDVRVDPEPEKGFYYRSDHFSFAKRGVPALDVDEGIVFVDKPEEYGTQVRHLYTTRDYHKPSDEVKPDWDLSGAAQDLQLLFGVGFRVAEADRYPEWKPGNEFKSIRDAMQTHIKETEAFRAKHEADYTRDYVSLAGLYFLHAGSNSVGSASGSDVVLPARAPASVGRIVYENSKTRFEPSPGAPVTLDGKPVTKPIEVRSDGSDAFDQLAVGDITFWVHESGVRRTIRVRDPEGQVARSFAGFRWFPIDERYRVVGRFIRDAAPRTVKIPLQTGDEETYTTEGVVEFVLNGQTIRMRPMTTRPGRLYFIFRDATSGNETYEAARFLYSDLAADGTTVLDFNQAYNPPCSFNPFTTCPLPPAENRLTVRIPVGERAYAGHAPVPGSSR